MSSASSTKARIGCGRPACSVSTTCEAAGFTDPSFAIRPCAFAGISEEKLSKHLYLNLSKNGAGPEIPIREPRLVRKHRQDSVKDLARLQDGQPFNIYGTTRTEPETPFRVVGQGD